MADPRFLPKDRDGRLFRLVEEMGELAAAIGKAGRHGMHNYNPDLPPAERVTNAEWIKAEMADVRGALDDLAPDIDAIIAAIRKRENADG